ncbi:MAG: hypothetical protein ACFFCE_15955 [Promethearchaeota archaeon]
MKKITEKIDLKEIEKKTWRSTLEDGILDIYFGILILGLGMGMTLSPVVPNPLDKFIPIIFIGIGLAFFLTAKKMITQPRLGIVKFGIKRKGRKLKTLVVLSINLLILLILFLIRFTNPELSLEFPGYLDGLILGLLFITAPVCFAAYFIQHPRFYIIGLLVGLSFFLSDLLSIFIPEPFDVLVVFSIISGITIIMGIVSLIKFLRKYPLSKEEMA